MGLSFSTPPNPAPLPEQGRLWLLAVLGPPEAVLGPPEAVLGPPEAASLSAVGPKWLARTRRLRC